MFHRFVKETEIFITQSDKFVRKLQCPSSIIFESLIHESARAAKHNFYFTRRCVLIT